MDFVSNTQIDSTTLALDALAQRNKLIIANIANADTPGYKRVDLRFEDQLGKIIQNDLTKEYIRQNSTGEKSNGVSFIPSSLHEVLGNSAGNSITQNLLSADSGYESFEPQIEVEEGTSLRPDGNNVNIEYEMAELAKNGTKYAALAEMQARAFKGLQDIITRTT